MRHGPLDDPNATPREWFYLGVDVRVRMIELEPDDLAVPFAGFVSETEPARQRVEHSQSSTTRFVGGHGGRRTGDDLAECFGRGDAVVHFDSYTDVELHHDRQFRSGVADDVRDELACEQHGEGRIEIAFSQAGRDELASRRDAGRFRGEIDRWHGTPRKSFAWTACCSRKAGWQNWTAGTSRCVNQFGLRSATAGYKSARAGRPRSAVPDRRLTPLRGVLLRSAN
ncbi:MAG: hypothetical protein QOD50_1188 [Actinomycetota bacterium]|nr:hypothetical protein [Actinomycetota bacterium]